MKKNVFVVMVSILILTVTMGCKNLNSPPDMVSVESQYITYSEDIEMIVGFLSNSRYEDILISDSAGYMLADLEQILIGDDAVLDAVRRIINSKAYLSIRKNGNTISLLQWTGLRDIGCGIVYSINGTDAPEIEYVTQLTPMSASGWFYYVSDYEAWRNAKQAINH